MEKLSTIVWGTLGLAVCGIIFYAMMLCADVARSIWGVPSAATKSFVELAEGFRKENITETFREELQSIKSTGQGNLEVALMTGTESFRRSSTQTVLWDAIDLGTTSTEISVPATYRYHVRLADEWKLDVRSHEVVVIAPALRASLPVAIDTGRMRKSVREGWFRFDGQQQMAKLERKISSTLNRNANRNKNLVREQSRKTIEQFIKHWLQRNGQWSEDGFTNVRVVFQDEPKPKLL